MTKWVCVLKGHSSLPNILSYIIFWSFCFYCFDLKKIICFKCESWKLGNDRTIYGTREQPAHFSDKHKHVVLKSQSFALDFNCLEFIELEAPWILFPAEIREWWHSDLADGASLCWVTVLLTPSRSPGTEERECGHSAGVWNCSQCLLPSKENHCQLFALKKRKALSFPPGPHLW